MFLVDANVVSELMRPRPAPPVLAWAELQPSFALSVVTVEELRCALAHRPHAALARWLTRFLAACELVPVDAAIAARCGELRGRLARAGRARHQADLLIAATALERRLPLATRNVRDFEGCGVRLLNPFGR